MRHGQRNLQRQAWLGLAALWMIGFIGAISRFIMASYQVQMADDLHVGRSFVSAAWSTNLLIAALCAPIGGRLADRYGPKKLMLVSSIAGICGAALVYSGHSPAIFFVGYGIVSGLAGMGASSAYLLLFGWFERHRAKAAGLLNSASSVGLAVCTPVFLANGSLTWEHAFLLSALLGLLITIPLIVFMIRPDKGEPAGSAQSDSTELPIDNDARLLPSKFNWPIAIIAFALFTCGINMGTVEMNLVAIHQEAKVASESIALSMGVLGVMEIVGSLAFGMLMDVMNKGLVMMTLYGIRILSFMILFFHFAWTPVLFAITFGLTYLGAVPGGMLIANEFTRNKGRLVGNLMLFHQCGGILGALIGGVFYDIFRNYQLLIGIDAALCGLAVAGYSVFRHRHRMRKGALSHAS